MGGCRSRCKVASALAVAVLLGGALLAAEADKPGVAWLKDFPSTVKQARETNRLIMVDFYTSWCVYCKHLDREAFVDPRVVELSKKFAAVKLDADVHKTVTTRYRPEGYPTIIFATADGDEIVRIGGYKTADQIYSVMKQVVEIGPRVAELMARTDKDRKDWTAQEELGRIYLDNEVFTLATDHLGDALKALPPAERSVAPDAESGEERIQFMLARASAGDEDYKKAVKLLDKLIADNPRSPRAPDYYVALEKVYTGWNKSSEAEKVKATRLRLFDTAVH